VSGADHRPLAKAQVEKPVTEPKRSQNSKRPLFHFPQPHGYSFSENAPLSANNE
jgi:hypothetical protein